MTRKKTTLERTYDASIDDVWELWTTKEGIESWWGPEGFTTTVKTLEARPGGRLVYVMRATAAEIVAGMKAAGMPLETEAHATFGEIVEKKRLSLRHTVDFAGVAPYEIETVVELHATGGSVRMVVTFEAMHDETWTARAIQGWESQLRKVPKAVARAR